MILRFFERKRNANVTPPSSCCAAFTLSARHVPAFQNKGIQATHARLGQLAPDVDVMARL